MYTVCSVIEENGLQKKDFCSFFLVSDASHSHFFFSDTNLFLWVFNICFLIRLTWLIHTSVLPSKWNLYPKMMVKSGLQKLFWNPSMREDSYFHYWICNFGHFYEVKENSLPHEGISKSFFLYHFSPSFLNQKWLFQELRF